MEIKTARATYDGTDVTTTDGMTYRIWRVLTSSNRFMDIESQRITKTGLPYKTDQNQAHFTTIAHHAIASVTTGGTT